MKDMLGRGELVSVDKAIELIFSHTPSKKLEEINLSIDEAYGYVVSKDIVSPEDLPDFNRSTVDGYAINSADTFGASETSPAYINLTDEVKMGVKPDFILQRGSGAKIATGGMLPEGSDSVVMFEHVNPVDNTMIEVIRSVFPGENVIHKGEDFKKGEVVIKKGKRLRPQDIGALAGLGITSVSVYRKLKVAIISTGDEIVPADVTPLEGQVRDINSYSLKGLIIGSGCIPVKKGLFKDEYETLKGIVEESLKDSDVVIITGGSSVGMKDLTARIINELGRPGVIFHGVSLKPGKPTIFGLIDKIPVFGLPGHPSAVIICYRIFVEPLLEFLSGIEENINLSKRLFKAKISRNISSSSGREEHIPVILEENDGQLWATPLLGKSGFIATLSRADGTAIIPLRKTGVKAGDIVDIRLF